ncbi:hypothetical protein, partial [Pseudoalteromonas sp. GW168-MNA-CIBAN-0100]|uniref:hypothetical protein n=1 Tax=Pseudoalteromonas sp. GW168-MNA-CIBAN-0100 TaxID=3140434 RepID=UPI0033319D49
SIPKSANIFMTLKFGKATLFLIGSPVLWQIIDLNIPEQLTSYDRFAALIFGINFFKLLQKYRSLTPPLKIEST